MSKKVITVSEVNTRVGSLCKFDAKELEKIGQVNYLTAVGNPITRSFICKDNNGTHIATFERTTSACAHVKLIPTLGRSISDGDGSSTATNYIPIVANQTAAYIYQLLYNKNMNTANFSAADILKIILAIDSILAKVSEIKMDLQVVSKSWNEFDLGMPAILSRPYINYTDAMQNRAQYIDQLDTLINRLAVIEIPLDLKYITWHCSLLNKLLVDDPLHKTTYYRFIYGAYWIYNHSTGDCALENIPITTTTIGTDIAKLNSMIDELVADEDILNLLANIRLIFGGQSISVKPFEDVMPEFTYDYMVLSMLKNANYGPSGPTMVADYVLTEVAAGVKTSALQVGLAAAPVGVSNSTNFMGISQNDWIISYDANDPKADELVLMAHWVNTFRSKPGVTDDGSNEYLWYHGSEIISLITVKYVVGAAGTMNMTLGSYDVDGTDIHTAGNLTNPVAPWRAVLIHQSFTFLPRTYFIYLQLPQTLGSVAGCLWSDTENLFKVSNTYISGAHEYTLRNQVGISALPE